MTPTAQPRKIPLSGSKREFATLYIPEYSGQGTFGCLGKGYVIFTDDQGRSGLMNTRGEILLPAEPGWSNFLLEREAGVLLARKGDLTILFDLEGNPLAGCALEELLKAERGILVLDTDGTPVYLDSLNPFSDGLALGRKGSRCYFVNPKGRTAIRMKEGVECEDFHEGMATFSRRPKLLHRRKYGFLDKEGKIVIPEAYTIAGGFSRGIAVVQDGSGWHFLRPDGSELETFHTAASDFLTWGLPKVKLPHYFESDYTIVMRGTSNLHPVDGWTVLHKSGEYTGGVKALLELTKEEGVFLFCDDTYDSDCRRYGLLDPRGNHLLEEEYEKIWSIGHGAFIVKKDGKFGLADRNGNLVAPLVWDNIVHRTDCPGFAMDHAVIVTKDGKRGLMDFQGRLLLPAEYPSNPLFNGDLALVNREGGAVLMNLHQCSALPDDVQILNILMDGLLLVSVNGEIGFLDYGCDE